MKEIIGLVGNVTKSLKSTLVGASLILLFSYQYVKSEKPLILMSADTAVLVIGVALLFASDGVIKPTDKPK